jgi:hypothetical protein
MDPNDIEISRLRDREYVQGLPNEAIIYLAERWIATGHYHCQNDRLASGRKIFDWTEFPDASRFFEALAETNGIDSSPIADLAERTSHCMDIDKSVAQLAIVIVRRLIARIRSGMPAVELPDIPDLGDSEIRLILALGHEKKIQTDLIADAGYSETSGTMKKALSILVQRRILGNGGRRDPGYFLKPAYVHILAHFKTTRPDLLQLVGRKSK